MTPLARDLVAGIQYVVSDSSQNDGSLPGFTTTVCDLLHNADTTLRTWDPLLQPIQGLEYVSDHGDRGYCWGRNWITELCGGGN